MHETIFPQVLQYAFNFPYNSIKNTFWMPCHFYREQLVTSTMLGFLRPSSQHSIDRLWKLDMSVVFSSSHKVFL